MTTISIILLAFVAILYAGAAWAESEGWQERMQLVAVPTAALFVLLFLFAAVWERNVTKALVSLPFLCP